MKEKIKYPLLLISRETMECKGINQLIFISQRLEADGKVESVSITWVTIVDWTYYYASSPA